MKEENRSLIMEAFQNNVLYVQDVYSKEYVVNLCGLSYGQLNTQP